jgi:Family of unknown function (DUF5681)
MPDAAVSETADRPWLWKPGQTGNPAGRPKGTGHLLAESFKRDLVDEWKRRGADALKELTPYQLARLVVDALPRELLMQVEHATSPFDGMTSEELQQTLADVRAYRLALNAKQIDGKAG